MTRDAEHTPSPQSVAPEAPARAGGLGVGSRAIIKEHLHTYEVEVIGIDGDTAWIKYLSNGERTSVLLHYLTPRHEAPADHHERNLTASNAELIEQALSHPPLEAPAEGAGELLPCPFCGGEASERMISPGINTSDDFEAISCGSCGAMISDATPAEWNRRARSSAPEAREEALGNLLAVIHGDGGHRALEVGTKQAALEAEKIVAGLFAAPSADKLRTALSEIRDGMVASRDCISVDDWIELADEALKGEANP